MQAMRNSAVGVLILLVLLASGCAATKKKLTAEDFYRIANEEFEDGNYTQAIVSYRELLDQYPFSEYAEEAEIKIAHAHYKAEQYPEAIAAFNDFQRMHPTSSYLPMVYYLMGMSFMEQMSTIDRDQTASENAHGWFKVAIDRYPNSSYAEKAREEIRKCREAMADHELYVAKFYFRQGNLDAAENRVKGILELYPDTTVAPRALATLAQQWDKSGKNEQAELARRALLEKFAKAPEARQEAKKVPDSGTNYGAFAALLAGLRERFGAASHLAAAATQPSLAGKRTGGRTGATGAPPAPGFGFPSGGGSFPSGGRSRY